MKTIEQQMSEKNVTPAELESVLFMLKIAIGQNPVNESGCYCKDCNNGKGDAKIQMMQIAYDNGMLEPDEMLMFDNMIKGIHEDIKKHQLMGSFYGKMSGLLDDEVLSVMEAEAQKSIDAGLKHRKEFNI